MMDGSQIQDLTQIKKMQKKIEHEERLMFKQDTLQ